MRLRFVVVSCVVSLGGSLPGLAQQPTLKPAANAETDAGLKRPAGTVTRPKDGVQHPDLDKAWSKYDAAVSNAYSRVRAEIVRQFDAATAEGDLDAAEKWQAALKTYDSNGQLPAEAKVKAVVMDGANGVKQAKDELAEAYEAVVKALTKEKKISEAKAVREESRAINMTSLPARTERPIPADPSNASTRSSTAPPAVTNNKEDKVEKPRAYDQVAEECKKAVERRRLDLAAQYSSAVHSLKSQFQQEGALDKAIAADKEWTRATDRKPLTAEDVVDAPEELKRLQKDYLAKWETVDEKTAKEFLAKLDVEAGELAKKGMLAEGRVLQQEIAQIKRLYLTESKKTTSDATPPQEDPVAACEKAIRQRQIDLQLQYSGELEALEKASQAKGALEDMFAVKAERQRYLETPILAASNLVETPSSLRELQDKYLEWQEGLAAKVVEEFVARLEQQKQSLTIEGKLEEAVKAKEAVEKVRQKLLVSSNDRNRQVLKRFIGKYRFENGNIEEIAPNGVYLVDGSASHEWGGRWELDSTNPKRPCVTRYANNGTVTHWYIHPQLPHTLVSEKGGTITRISVPPSVRSR
jgi:hypothetical protein